MTKKLLALASGAAALAGSLMITAPTANAATSLKIKSELTSDCLASESDLLAQVTCISSEFSNFGGTTYRFEWSATSTGTGKMKLRHRYTGMCLDNDGWTPYFGNCVNGDSGQEWNITSCATTNAELTSNGKYLTAWPDGGLSMRGPGEHLSDPDSRQWQVTTSPWC